jgi:FeS assembly SUF system protein
MSEDKKKLVEEFLSVDTPSLDTETSDENLQCHVIGDRVIAKKVIAALATVYDPEIPVHIYALGLIYKLEITSDHNVKIEMTLTAPGCPVAHLFPSMVQGAVESVEEVDSTEVEIIWDPAWTQERMSEAARLELGMF